MTIKRIIDAAEVHKNRGFSVNCNIILSGSKRMSGAEQEVAMTVEKVRLLVVDASDPDNVLVDDFLEAKEFKTGSVGYGLQLRGVKFEQVEQDA